MSVHDDDKTSEMAEVLLKDLDANGDIKPAVYNEPGSLTQDKKEAEDVVIDAKYLAAQLQDKAKIGTELEKIKDNLEKS